jgi:hypothetical protein
LEPGSRDKINTALRMLAAQGARRIHWAIDEAIAIMNAAAAALIPAEDGHALPLLGQLIGPHFGSGSGRTGVVLQGGEIPPNVAMFLGQLLSFPVLRAQLLNEEVCMPAD